MTPDRFIAAAFRRIACQRDIEQYNGFKIKLIVEELAAELARESVGDGELLPCPFCGSPADVLEDPSGCVITCGASSDDVCDPMPATWAKPTRAEAITAWNTRASEVDACRSVGGDVERDAARYRWLRDNPRCSLSLSHNDHHNMYLSVENTLNSNDQYYDEVDGAERERMIQSDTIWTVHEYPNTPVGFNVWHAASLDSAIDAALAGVSEGK